MLNVFLYCFKNLIKVWLICLQSCLKTQFQNVFLRLGTAVDKIINVNVHLVGILILLIILHDLHKYFQEDGIRVWWIDTKKLTVSILNLVLNINISINRT